MVLMKVDMSRREKLRRLHTATHIVNFCAREVLGNHVWQNGSNLKPEFGTLDITHYQNLTQREIQEIEKKANETIFENKKVTIEELERTEAEKKYGFVLYQGGAIPRKTLRVIKVLDSDIEACGGLHMESTGGIGLIKIVDSQKIQDGVVRLKFVVRSYSLEYIHEEEKVLFEVQKVFSVDSSSLVKTSQKFFDEWKEQKKTIEKLKKQLKNTYISLIEYSIKDEFEVKDDIDMGFMMEIFTSVLSKRKSFKLLSPKFVIATSDLSVEGAKKEINKGKFVIYVM